MRMIILLSDTNNTFSIVVILLTFFFFWGIIFKVADGISAVHSELKRTLTISISWLGSEHLPHSTKGLLQELSTYWLLPHKPEDNLWEAHSWKAGDMKWAWCQPRCQEEELTRMCIQIVMNPDSTTLLNMSSFLPQVNSFGSKPTVLSLFNCCNSSPCSHPSSWCPFSTQEPERYS